MKLRYIAPAVAAATLLLAGTGVAYAQAPTVDPLAACQAAAETLATEQARLDGAVAADKAAADAVAADKAEKAALDALVLAQANAESTDNVASITAQAQVETRIAQIKTYLAIKNGQPGGPANGADRRAHEQRLELRQTQLAAIIDLAAEKAEADKTDAGKLAKTADKTNAADLTIVRDAALKARDNACGTTTPTSSATATASATATSSAATTESSAVVIPPAGDATVIADADVPLGSVSTGAM